jgi:phenylalanyl-tRNA synthetase beta subunit
VSAIPVTLQPTERTLTDADIEAVAAKQTGGTPRG